MELITRGLLDGLRGWKVYEVFAHFNEDLS